MITSTVPICANDPGRLATIGGLVRDQIWTNTTPKFVPGANESPDSFNDYYSSCVVTFFQAFVPLVTAVNVNMTNPNASGSWPTYKGKPVYVSPTHTFTDSLNEVYNGALLQYASAKDQSKPLGPDLGCAALYDVEDSLRSGVPRLGNPADAVVDLLSSLLLNA